MDGVVITSIPKYNKLISDFMLYKSGCMNAQSVLCCYIFLSEVGIKVGQVSGKFLPAYPTFSLFFFQNFIYRKVAIKNHINLFKVFFS